DTEPGWRGAGCLERGKSGSEAEQVGRPACLGNQISTHLGELYAFTMAPSKPPRLLDQVFSVMWPHRLKR
ncbi:MAG: hypothetical protein AAFW84_28125, partial [Cyanobacteria bacterium J06635_15]